MRQIRGMRGFATKIYRVAITLQLLLDLNNSRRIACWNVPLRKIPLIQVPFIQNRSLLYTYDRLYVTPLFYIEYAAAAVRWAQ